MRETAARGEETRAVAVHVKGNDRMRKAGALPIEIKEGVGERVREALVVERPVGVTVQQLVGRLFRSGYVATPASYKAALIMSEWPRANPAKALWWRWSGRLSRSKAMLWEIGADDPACIHATTIAFHNVVAAVERLRAAAGASDAGTRPVYQVLRESLVAPATLLRSVTDDVRVPSLQRPLRKGTLLIFKLGTIYDRTRDPALAFARSEWNQCPGHDVVPRALEAVWTRAMALQRGRP